ncbi:hypothetical protein BU17DRAFT_97083 [Hysterangium stoloniferum]|nr:hypothetical protein BU17DRAFT_97083 [Hysterangium stoloniferum]
MSETLHRATRPPPVLLPLSPKPAGLSTLVGGLLQCLQGGGVTLLGPPARPKPMVGAWRWIGCSSREKSIRTSWVLAMLLVVPVVIAYQGMGTTAIDHPSVALDVVRSAPPTTVHGPMGKCVLRTKLQPHDIIGHHGSATQGPNAWHSVQFGVVKLRKTDNSLENTTWITRIYRVKRLTEVAQGIAIPNENFLDFWIEMADSLFDGLPLTMNSKPPEGDDSGGPIANSGAYNFEDALLSNAKYNQAREGSCCPETADERTRLKHPCHNVSDHVPDVVDTVPKSTVHMSRFYSSHHAAHLKPQQSVTNTLWRSLGAYVRVGMGMPDTPAEDGTTGTQEISHSLARSDWQLRFENVVDMIASAMLHIPTDDSEVYSSHLYGDLQMNRTIASRLWSVYSVHVQNGRVRGWLVGSLDKPVQVRWRLEILWEFSEAVREISETPQRATRPPPVLLPLPPKPAGPSMLVGGLLQYHQGGGVTLLGPSGRPKPMVGARRWMGCSSVWTSWLFTMLLVLFVIAYQGLCATARHHLAVALGVVRSAPPTTIHGPMGKCVLRTKLQPHDIIGHHGSATQGPNAWRSVQFGVVKLRKTDNSLENTTWITRIYRVKRFTEVSQGIAIPNETSLDFCIERTGNLFDGLPLTTNSKPPEAAHLKPQQSVINMLWRSLGAYVHRDGMGMPDTPAEDGTTGNQAVSRSLAGSYWQLRFENVVGMAASATLHIPTDDSEVYSSHPYGDVQTNQTIASILRSVYSVHVQDGRSGGGWRRFFGSLQKQLERAARWKGQGSIASIEDTDPFKATQSPS